ncbi:MAG: hypothetical protein ACE5JS_11640 [Nitrospinota bacterium]
MGESNTGAEIAELRQALAVLHLDLLLHKGLSSSARWRAERGVDVALFEFGAAERVLADTPWPEGVRKAAQTLGKALIGYRESIAAFDATRENFFRTLLNDGLWGLKEAIFGWPRERPA